MTPLAALGALVVVLNCMSPVHKPLRRVCQGWLHSQVHQQLSIVAWAQQWTNSTLDKAVLVSAATVTLEFYLTLLPILAWCGYGRQLTLLIALMALQGQAGGCFWLAALACKAVQSPQLLTDCRSSLHSQHPAVMGASSPVDSLVLKILQQCSKGDQ